MNKFFIILLLLAVAAVLPSCDKNDPPLPDNLVAFTTGELGFDEGLSELDVNINASRAVEEATRIIVTLQADGLTYGTDFTTEPAASNNTITLSIPAGATGTSFKLKKADGLLTDGDESVSFSVSEVAQPALKGEVSDLKVSFSSITSAGSALQLEGGAGEASAVSSVFVDLSANRQTSVLRNSWDLGFWSGAEFRVRINNTTGASAVQVNKTDLNQVSSADINPDDLKLGRGVGSFALFDDVSGDITKTVIAEVSATATENKVYVINREGGAGSISPVDDLYKVRILRKDNGYTLQYAKINATTFQSIDVTKDAAYNFQFVTFGKDQVNPGMVNVEPQKDKWDFEWGWSMYFTGTTPYGFSDLVFINHQAGVQAAEVLTSTVSYDNFDENSLSRLTFSGARDVIGPNWRATTGVIGVKTDRFYVIKDAAGNIYKLKFINFHPNDGGERGRPKLESSLVKKGA